MRHVVVTGGAGFIGSNIVDAYLRDGWKVTVVDDLSTGLRKNVSPDAELIVGDLREPALLDRIFETQVDLVNHQAAQVDVRKSVADPALDADLNIIASIRLFVRAMKSGVKKVIFASSGGAAYGEPQFVPQGEDHPFAPMSPYGCAKASVELYLRCFGEMLGVETVSLRYANVYGPRQRPDGEAGVVAIFAGKMLEGETVTINGDGAQTRDYVFVEDVARANLAVSNLPLSGAFNVGTGVETSVVALHELMASVMGIAANATHAPAKRGEQLRSVLDGTRLRREAQLPEPQTFRDGLMRTLEWMKSERS